MEHADQRKEPPRGGEVGFDLAFERLEQARACRGRGSRGAPCRASRSPWPRPCASPGSTNRRSRNIRARRGGSGPGRARSCRRRRRRGRASPSPAPLPATARCSDHGPCCPRSAARSGVKLLSASRSRIATSRSCSMSALRRRIVAFVERDLGDAVGGHGRSSQMQHASRRIVPSPAKAVIPRYPQARCA